jgi:glycosyltransferase involved in cell wall biosynthesis
VRERGIPVQTTVVGDGPVRGELAKLTTAEGLDDAVRFTGALAFDEVQRWYEWADVLVLASEAEGWPKAIAEAMSFGVVCLGSARGFIPRMLEDGRGVLVQPGDVEGLATALAAVAGEPERHLAIGRRAADWARRYSLEGLADALRALLTEQWQVLFPPMPPATSTVSESPPGSPPAGFPNPVASPRSRLPERAP